MVHKQARAVQLTLKAELKDSPGEMCSINKQDDGGVEAMLRLG